MLGEVGQHWMPVRPTWALNERHYGALTGMSKTEATTKLGKAEVAKWRRSWSHSPPPIEAGHSIFDQLETDATQGTSLLGQRLFPLPGSSGT